MDLLVNYDKENIPEARLKKLRKQYINAEEMQVEVITKVSKAGSGLCQWVGCYCCCYIAVVVFMLVCLLLVLFLFY